VTIERGKLSQRHTGQVRKREADLTAIAMIAPLAGKRLIYRPFWLRSKIYEHATIDMTLSKHRLKDFDG